MTFFKYNVDTYFAISPNKIDIIKNKYNIKEIQLTYYKKINLYTFLNLYGIFYTRFFYAINNLSVCAVFIYFYYYRLYTNM